MKPFERLRCPTCKGCLVAGPGGGLTCSGCETKFSAVDGVVDLGSDHIVQRPSGDRIWSRTGINGLLGRMQAAVADRWPVFAGDTVVVGCCQDDVADAIMASRTASSLLLLDTEMEALRGYRLRQTPDETVVYAAVGDFGTVIGDAVVDTLVCPGLLSEVTDVRTFLATVHRVLKPGGRAAFVVPNRRYWQAMCAAMAEALVQHHGKERTWLDGYAVVSELLAQTRRLLLHRDDAAVLAELPEKHLFDSDTLEDWGHEIGFDTAEALPLNSDPAGVETARQMCRHAGSPDSFAEPFGALVGAVGQTYFSLLARPDQSASMLVWLTKASGPRARIFAAPPSPPSPGPLGPDAAVGGAEPRWSVELLARDTPDGIAVTLGGWCLCNVSVRWVRLTLDGVAQSAPVWRPRPDVHEVLNGRGLYDPMSAICSGLDSELMFAGVHPSGSACPFRLEIILANGVTVTGGAPERLIMDEQMVVAH